MIRKQSGALAVIVAALGLAVSARPIGAVDDSYLGFSAELEIQKRFVDCTIAPDLEAEHGASIAARFCVAAADWSHCPVWFDKFDRPDGFGVDMMPLWSERGWVRGHVELDALRAKREPYTYPSVYGPSAEHGWPKAKAYVLSRPNGGLSIYASKLSVRAEADGTVAIFDMSVRAFEADKIVMQNHFLVPDEMTFNASWVTLGYDNQLMGRLVASQSASDHRGGLLAALKTAQCLALKDTGFLMDRRTYIEYLAVDYRRGDLRQWYE